MTNRLATSTSPYLLQHAANPVDWFEWGEEAFETARRRGRPVLLSVGYSACHWCHVMAHESFEDPETAAMMNRLFVNVKVDREERPDVDAVYMEAVQAMTGHGGWPMTVWLTPEGKPYYAGTYFPSVDRPGMPSFRRVLEAVAAAWDERRPDVEEQAARITAALATHVTASESLPATADLEAAYARLVAAFDPVHGGFGTAPKFPQAPVLEFLLRILDRPFAPRARRMLGQTLVRMARGGIHDQLGGGFSRYSVDERWLVPHFEKMLYDNALLARIYLWAGLELGDPDLGQVARTTLDFLLTRLRNEHGAFLSAEDADSEGEEGRYYVWSHDEFTAVAGRDAAVAGDHFGVTPAGNFEGRNVLHAARLVTEVAEEHGLAPEEAALAIERVRRKLLDRRRDRIRPGVDDKVVAAWNGLAIRAMADAGAALNDHRYLQAGRRAAEFLVARMTTPDGRLVRTWAAGRPGAVGGFLEDYAAVALGLLGLFQATGEGDWFRGARALVEQIERLFSDGRGGLYADASGDLIKRPQDLFDNPAPSGTAMAAEACCLLALYTGDVELIDRAGRYLRSIGKIIEGYPGAAGHALAVVAGLERGTRELAVVGPAWQAVAAPFWKRYRPHMVLAGSPDGGAGAEIPLLAGRGQAGRTFAYLCTGLRCLAPVESADELSTLLEST